MAVFLLFSIPIILQCINHYSNDVIQSEEFQRLEKMRMEKSLNMIRSGLRGTWSFNSLANETPVSVLFHGAALFDTLHSTVDNSGVLLDIVSKSSKNIPEKQSGVFAGLSRYKLFILGFLSSLLGLCGTRNKKRRKFLLNMGGCLSVSAGLFLSRQLYIIITLTLLFITVFICFLAKGVPLSGAEVKLTLVNFAVSAVIMAIFLLAGLLAGLTGSMFKGAMVVATAWIMVIFILPGALNLFFINPLIENMKSLNENEARKFKIFIDFDNMVKKKFKEINPSEWKQLSIDMNKQFLDVEYEKIKKMEADMIRESEAVVKKICFINMFTPGTFYESVSGEMTVGYRALLDFHRFNFEKQQKIVEFYIRSYFDKSIELPDIPVVFQLKSRLPYYFTPGLLFNILLAVLAFALFYVCFSRAMFPRVKKNFKEINITAQKGDYFLLNLRNGGSDFCNKIFNTFFKGESFGGQITVAGRNIPALKAFYLPDLRGIKPQYLRLLSGGDAGGLKKKTFAELTYAELSNLFPSLKQSDILILDNLNFDHAIGPDENIFIIELNSQSVLRKYNQFYLIYADKGSYKIKMKRKENPLT